MEDDYNYVTVGYVFNPEDMVGGQLTQVVEFNHCGEIDITFKAVESLTKP